jgi:hypothetical protein
MNRRSYFLNKLKRVGAVPEEQYEQKLLTMGQKQSEVELANQMIAFKRERGETAEFEQFVLTTWPELAETDDASGEIKVLSQLSDPSSRARKIFDQVTSKSRPRKVSAVEYFKQLPQDEQTESFREDDECHTCGSAFGIFLLRYNCRACLGSFCSEHCKKLISLPSFWHQVEKANKTESLLERVVADTPLEEVMREQVMIDGMHLTMQTLANALRRVLLFCRC